MTAEDRYTTPAAFRRALTERLRQASKEGPWTVQQLQRQVAYDRLLERLYLIDDGWIVKGATALLARTTWEFEAASMSMCTGRERAR